ncbi:MAG: twin-arginine translocation signal domain-containing protein [Acidobacteriia bacterium]|nr:twin-arginine translocation signal domain-containing protein [Terriglobia bacterium]
MAKSQKTSVGRRGFLRNAAAGAAAGAAALVTPPLVEAQGQGQGRGTGTAPAPTGVPAPTQAQIDRETGNVRPPSTVRTITRPGSDLMVQTIRDLGIEYVAANPGSSFEGLQESFINYGNPPNKMPEFITALHEESAVTMAHGYAKAEGKPMLALLHGTIGIQHGAMSVYQAYYDRVPVLMIAGNDPDFIAAHTAHDMAGMVRSYTKWDAEPKTIDEALVAIQRAYNEAITPPMGPTLVVLGSEIQKDNAPNTKIPAYKPPVFVTIDATRAREIAKGLLEAQNPRIAVGRLRTPEGVQRSVELAELVGASTSTAATGGPMSFPQRHHLCGPGADTTYDYTLGLETAGAQASITGPALAKTAATRDTVNIGFGGTVPGAGGRGGGGGRAGRGGAAAAPPIEADAEASLPLIIEEVKRQMTADQKTRIQARIAKHTSANHEARVTAITQAVESKRAGWNGTPISTARLYAELWPLIMNEDWCLSSPSNFSGGHHVQLWDHNKPYSYLGGQGAGGMGYGAPASVGAALAAKARNRIVINVQTDGDLNYSPGVLWTAVHHKLPMLTVMHNNRAWHQEYMFVEYMAGVRGRGDDRAHIGSTLRDPYLDYAKMAAGYGMAGEGPITDPSKLSAALKRGVAAAKRGEPYLIDVITQPR